MIPLSAPEINYGKPWGTIFVATRLEKQVEAEFVAAWSGLLMSGLRAGDAVHLTRGRVAHVAQNENVRAFLKTFCDTFLSLDSDADFEPDFLRQLRDYQPGWVYDGFQAFHLRRAWPPRAIALAWNDAGGFMEEQMILGRGELDLGLVGTHCALIRREVFLTIYEAHGASQGIPLEDFEWFTYPRHKPMSDEAQFAHEARRLGFRLGGTTEVRVGHIIRHTIGWPEYQAELERTQAQARAAYYQELAGLIADFIGEPVAQVMAQALQGSENVRAAWQKANPQTAEAVRAFYGQRDNGYLYDLLAWNWGETYWKIIAGLDKYHEKTALVVGAGLGTEVARLKEHNDVDIFELAGILREFVRNRFGFTPEKPAYTGGRVENGRILELLVEDTLEDVASPWHKRKYDLIVAIDTLEHIHPDEIASTLEALGDLLAPGGVLYCHNNWGDQHLYPMHFDHRAVFEAWVQAQGLKRISAYEYRKD